MATCLILFAHDKWQGMIKTDELNLLPCNPSLGWLWSSLGFCSKRNLLITHAFTCVEIDHGAS